MRDLLGSAGNECYAELVRQTEAARAAIEREVRGRFGEFLGAVFGELTGFRMPPEELELAARLEAHRRMQAEIARRISEEVVAFRERLNRLAGWAQERKRRDAKAVAPDADGCGTRLAARCILPPVNPENAHDGEALRVLTGVRLDRYLALRSEFRDQAADVRQRHQEAMRWLTERRAPPEEQAALDRERDELIQYHADRFAERVRALIEDQRGDAAGD